MQNVAAASLRDAAAAALAAGRISDAVLLLLQLSEVDKTDPWVLVSLSALLIEGGVFEAAAGAALAAVERAPNLSEAQSNLGVALYRLGEPHKALGPSLRAVALAPQSPDLLANLSAVLLAVGLVQEARESALEAVRIDPGCGRGHSNAALALEACGEIGPALEHARVSARLQPDLAEPTHNLAALLLGAGQLTEEAWGAFEARLRLPGVARHVVKLRRWRGEDIAGQTILLHAEQGLGDTIQFIRYVPMVAARGARVIVVVQRELVRLLRDVPGAAEVVPQGMALPPHDVFSPLMSLPGIFGTDLDTIPPVLPVLAARPRSGVEPGALQVGLVWAGNPGFIHDRSRSIPAGVMAGLAGVEGVRFHSLQRGGTGIPGLAMTDSMDEVADFADTAALVERLDLVIAVDTAVAHVAASMGRPVWLLSRFSGCWRWLHDRSDSPWYPQLRLYRQSRPGDWEEVITRVRRDLTAQAAAHRRAA